MVFPKLIVLLFSLFLLAENPAYAQGSFTFDGGSFWLDYKFPDDNSITITMSAKSNGYISLGFGGTMTNCDMVTGSMNNGSPSVVDKWSYNSRSDPVADAQNDITNPSGSRASGTTTFTFTRKLKTGDSKDTDITPNQQMSICFAIGSSDRFNQHINYGSSRITFQKTANIVCDSTCATCSGTASNNCVTCPSGKILSSGSCLATTQTGCDSTCASCLTSSPSVCLTCDSTKTLSSGKCVANDVSLPNNYAKMGSAGLTFYWDFQGDEVIMALVSNNDGWYSIGTSQSMKDSDMIVIEINESTGQVELSDNYSSSHDSPPRDTDRGGKNDLTLLGFTGFVNGKRIVKFKRKQKTGDSWDRDFTQNSQFDVNVARTGDKRMRNHGDLYWIYEVNFTPGFQGDATEIDKTLLKITKVHEIINIIGWGFLADIGIIAARNFRHKKYYMIIHLICFLLTDFGSIIIGIIMLAKYSSRINEISVEDSTFKAHIAFGIISVILTFFQHVGGVILKHKFLEGPHGDVRLYTFKMGHLINGYFLYLIGKINILIGFKLSIEDDKFIALIIIFCIEIGIHLIIQYIYAIQSRWLFSKGQPEQSKYPDHDKLMKLLADNKSNSEIKSALPYFKWVIFNNSVYELNNFLHPGGNFIIDKIIGKEIGRYLFGAFGLEGYEMKGYAHTIYTYDMLEKRYVGSLGNILPNMLTGKDGNGKIWRLKTKKSLSKATSLFLFENSSCKVQNYMPGVNWIGRHFTISAKSHNQTKAKVRLYTTILCFTQENEEYRNYLIKAYDALKSRDSPPAMDKAKSKDQSSTLPFIIKKYNFPDAFSRFIHESEQTEYLITGPIGRGMELTASLGGTIYLFAGGTGILPFLDFLDYLLKKAIFTVSQKSSSNIVNLYDEKYTDTFDRNLQVVLYGSFATSEDFTGFEFIKKLYDISNKEDLRLFDMLIRMEKGKKLEGVPMTDGYFNNEFVKKNVDNTKLSRVYICGPPGMNNAVPKALKKFGVAEGKIYIV